MLPRSLLAFSNRVSGTLFRQMTRRNPLRPSNLTFSSFSVFRCLTLLLAGSRGSTEDEIRQILSIPSSVSLDDLFASWKALEGQLRRGGVISFAEAAFFSHGALKTSYEEACAGFGALVKSTTFPHPGVNLLNQFVSRKTKGMIRYALDPGGVSPLVDRVFLVSCLVFKAEWQKKFSETRDNYTFNSFDGPCYVPMMMDTDTWRDYGKHQISGVQFLSCTLRYKAGDFGLLFLRPVVSSLENFKALTNLCSGPIDEEIEEEGEGVDDDVPSFLSTVLDQQKGTELGVLGIPRFQTEGSKELLPTLREIGLNEPFEPSSCDLSGMIASDVQTPFYVSRVLHRTKLVVDEWGTIAAALTIVPSQSQSFGRRIPNDFVLNCPFLCFLVHVPTKVVVFSARLTSFSRGRKVSRKRGRKEEEGEEAVDEDEPPTKRQRTN